MNTKITKTIACVGMGLWIAGAGFSVGIDIGTYLGETGAHMSSLGRHLMFWSGVGIFALGMVLDLAYHMGKTSAEDDGLAKG